MTSDAFAAWAAHMAEARGWSRRRCAKELGCGVNQVAIWARNGAPIYIGLACAALSRGLAPWSQARLVK